MWDHDGYSWLRFAGHCGIHAQRSELKSHTASVHQYNLSHGNLIVHLEKQNKVTTYVPEIDITLSQAEILYLYQHHHQSSTTTSTTVPDRSTNHMYHRSKHFILILLHTNMHPYYSNEKTISVPVCHSQYGCSQYDIAAMMPRPSTAPHKLGHLQPHKWPLLCCQCLHGQRRSRSLAPCHQV